MTFNMEFFEHEVMRYRGDITPFTEMEHALYVVEMLKRGDKDLIETAYQKWLTLRLQREREAYRKKGISESNWPAELQNLTDEEPRYIDWRPFLGIESLPENKQNHILSLVSEEKKSSSVEEVPIQQPAQQPKMGNPFVSDSFGQLLGSDPEGEDLE